jgi:hypothetical protein
MGKKIETYKNTTMCKNSHTKIEAMCILFHSMFKHYWAMNVPPNPFSYYNGIETSLILVCLPCMFENSNLFSILLHFLHQTMAPNFGLLHLQKPCYEKSHKTP